MLARGILVDGRGVEQFTTAYPSRGSVLLLERNRETSTNLNARSPSTDLRRSEQRTIIHGSFLPSFFFRGNIDIPAKSPLIAVRPPIVSGYF